MRVMMMMMMPRWLDQPLQAGAGNDDEDEATPSAGDSRGPKPRRRLDPPRIFLDTPILLPRQKTAFLCFPPPLSTNTITRVPF